MNLRGRIRRLEQRTGGRSGVVLLCLSVPGEAEALALEDARIRPCPDEEVGELLARGGPPLKVLIGIDAQRV